MDNGKNEGLISLVAKKIIVVGIVQGIGFRPLVYHIAQKHGVWGTVRNLGGQAEIIVQGSYECVEAFICDLRMNNNRDYEIVKMDIQEIELQEFDSFKIIESGSNSDIAIIPPDLPTCPKCTEELFNSNDRRHKNPFISCMVCGPRYTVFESLPYDRHNTTMVDFEMCPECLSEYTSPESRRFHAQTISCDACGPYLIFEELTGEEEIIVKDIDKTEICEVEISEKEVFWAKKTGEDISENDISEKEISGENIGKAGIRGESISEKDINKAEISEQDISNNTADIIPNVVIDKSYSDNSLSNEVALNKAIAILDSGGIIAIKGIGGYHFACSPFNETTVENLRKLKGREQKPFAIMFESIDNIREYCIVSEKEEEVLKSKAMPIVLLATKDNKIAFSTGKGSLYCGAFLPYTPLQILLIKSCGPLIMTSGNISDRPIIREDREMLSIKSEYLAGVLYNTRRIMRSVDDSVVKVIDSKVTQIIRRSRGYVPYPIFLSDKYGDKQVFAAGSDMKAAFCLYKKGNAVLSQYFGDLEEKTILDEYTNGVKDLSSLLKVSPNIVVCDMHPNYYSTRYSNSLKLPTIYVQHHHAHIASVMAEHELSEQVIGVAFDGTGYGTDGCVWGGEFLLCEGAEFKRAAHLQYASLIGGDQSTKDARKSATCFLINAGLEEYIKDERSTIIKAALKNKVNTVLSSSMGRLFDAVASILDIGHENRYEGECSIKLEKEATLAHRAGEEAAKLAFEVTCENDTIEIGTKALLKEICSLKNIRSKGALALGFHYAVSELILEVCEILRERTSVNTVALSGGVFQNTLLMEKTLGLLKKRAFRVYYNVAVPPNDGGISLGQTLIGLLR